MENNRISIGRDPRSDIRIDERWDTVSNNHAEIERNADTLIYYDHSTNGTIINGQIVHNTHVEIYSGDKISLAGAFELDWFVINKFFPNTHRPTVTINTRGGDQVSGKKTVKYEGEISPRYNVSKNPAIPSSDFGHAKAYSQADIDAEIEKWNWGAFFCSWLWGIFHKIYWPLLIILLSFIPYLGLVCVLCLDVYLGIRGSRIAWECGKYKDFDSYKNAQHEWAIGGLIWFALSACAIAFLTYSVMSALY